MELKGKRLVILGVGNMLKGDDGIGSAVAGELQSKEGKLVIDCEEVPEAYSKKIIDFRPEAVVIVDAIDFKAAPGEYFLAIVDENLQDYTPLSTHKIPLKILANIFKEKCGAEVYLLGVQPKNISFGEEMSPELEKTKAVLVQLFSSL